MENKMKEPCLPLTVSHIKMFYPQDGIYDLMKRMSRGVDYGVFGLKNIVPVPEHIIAESRTHSETKGLTNAEKWCMEHWGYLL